MFDQDDLRALKSLLFILTDHDVLIIRVPIILFKLFPSGESTGINFLMFFPTLQSIVFWMECFVKCFWVNVVFKDRLQ